MPAKNTTAEPSALKPHWFQILLSLADGEQHGLAIMNEVLERTDGSMRLWPAMLYGSLKRMVEQGLIEEREEAAEGEGDRRRFYGITPQGGRILSVETARLTRYLQVAHAKNVAGGAVT